MGQIYVITVIVFIIVYTNDVSTTLLISDHWYDFKMYLIEDRIYNKVKFIHNFMQNS